MLEVTIDEVRAVIDTEITDTQMQEYIFSTRAFLNAVFTGVSVSETLYKEMERWTTAHLIASSRDRQAKEEGAGGAYIKYGTMYGMGLASTSYGQHAMVLDYTGTLASLMGKAVKLRAIPTEKWQ